VSDDGSPADRTGGSGEVMAQPQYSDHARERMEERSITRQEVEYVLLHHDIEYSDRAGNPIYIGGTADRRIKVVVRKGSNPPYIITTAPRED